MKILFILGNGFDINLGMKTRYTDFYSHYQSLESKSEIIRELKQAISDQYNSWSDLELAFGQHTEKIKTIKELDEVIEDITEKLGDYLQEEENKFDFSKVSNKLIEDFCYPEKYLPKAENTRLINFKNKWKTEEWAINIMTLNYTLTIEKLLKKFPKNDLAKHHSYYDISLNGIEHIHGYVDDRMILGVNDVSQIRNTEFHSNIDATEALIKTECNKTYKHTIDEWCISEVLSANLICIFGSSIGDTDNFWWELIGDRLKKSECRLIIFTKGEEVPKRIAVRNARIEREIKKRFMDKIRLTDEEKIDIDDKIFVVVNAGIFSDILTS